MSNEKQLPELPEPLYLVMAGGDAFQSTIVPESKLDEAYLLTQWSDVDPDDEQQAGALEHFHDDDEWTHTEVTGRGDRLEFSLSLEDGWVQVIRLPDDAHAALAAQSQQEPVAWKQADAEAWGERHDLKIHGGDLFCAFEDAATLHLERASPPPAAQPTNQQDTEHEQRWPNAVTPAEVPCERVDNRDELIADLLAALLAHDEIKRKGKMNCTIDELQNAAALSKAAIAKAMT